MNFRLLMSHFEPEMYMVVRKNSEYEYSLMTAGEFDTVNRPWLCVLEAQATGIFLWVYHVNLNYGNISPVNVMSWTSFFATS